MTQEILPMILRLAEEDDYKPLYDNFLSGNRAFLLALAQSLKSRGRLDDAKTLCDHILEQAPQNIEALRLSIAVSGAKGNTAEALERLIFLKSTGHNPIELVDDIRQQIMLAPAAMDSLSAAGRLEDAFRISELLVALCPGVQMFVSNAIRYATLLKKEDELNKYKAELIRITAPDVKRLNEMATASHARGAFEEELKCRVEIFRHPEDAQRHSALRLENIDAALGLIFCGSVDDEKLNLVKEMMAAVPSIPPVPADGSEVNAYARFYRLYLEALNIDAVFGPPLSPLPHPALTFVSSNGAPIELAAISKLIKQKKVEAIFLAAASEGYFARYAQSYVSSILRACDCRCLVFVCISGPRHRLAEHVARFGTHDSRVIYCSDDIDPEREKYSVYMINEADPSPIPGPYYASIGLLSLHLLLHLATPIFVTGIDTVLQGGIRELIERCRDRDVVFNRHDTSVKLQSRLINSLVLVYPTEGAMIFARFLSNYLGSALQKTVQPSFFDQAALLMAKLHLEANCRPPKIGYFDKFDINNVMFNQTNVQGHRDLLSQFRFINIFSGGMGDAALSPKDIEATA